MWAEAINEILGKAQDHKANFIACMLDQVCVKPSRKHTINEYFTLHRCVLTPSWQCWPAILNGYKIKVSSRF